MLPERVLLWPAGEVPLAEGFDLMEVVDSLPS